MVQDLYIGQGVTVGLNKNKILEGFGDIAPRQAVRDTSRVHSKPTRRPVTNRQMPCQGDGRGRRPHLPVRGCPG